MPAISTSLAFPDDAAQGDFLAHSSAGLILERALGGRETTSTTAEAASLTETPTSTVSTTADNPFFTANPTAGTAEGVDNADDNSSGLAKTALEWVFAIAALLAITSFSLWRYFRMRRRAALSRRRSGSQSMLADRSRLVLPRTTGLPRDANAGYGNGGGGGVGYAADLAAFYPPSLTTGRYPFVSDPLPAHIRDHLTGGRAGRQERRARRAARGADIDEGGRRMGARDVDDMDGDDKDELPAYDVVGSPPRYDVDANANGMDLRPGEIRRHGDGGETVVVDGIPLTFVSLNGTREESVDSTRRRDSDVAPMNLHPC